LDSKRKRVENRGEGFCLSYRTWRIEFTAEQESRQILVNSIFGGYSESDLNAPNDPHGDKELHRSFAKRSVSKLDVEQIHGSQPVATL
jgi:hypothetical protein